MAKQGPVRRGSALLRGAGAASLVAGALVCVHPGSAAAAAAAPAACDTAQLSRAVGADTKVTQAALVAEGAAPAGGRAIAGLPAFCRVTGTTSPTADSSIGFELWIPAAAQWNGKFVATGNGGYAPALSTADMATALRQGYAVIGGDTGHTGNDMMFVVGHPEKMIDWGTRSVHAITVPGKQLVAAYQGKAPSRAYYIGCSTGGHQGYAEAQHYPDDFDGIIAGDPGNNRIALNIEFMWRFESNHPQGRNDAPILTSANTGLVTRAAVKACDKLDGVEDGVIDDPRACTKDRFDVGSLLCTPTLTSDCLTADQLNAVRKIYAGPTNPRTGAQIYPGLVVGSESGWASYWGSNEPTRADFWRYWVFGDANYDWWKFNFDSDVTLAQSRVGAAVDQVNPNLGSFKARGGKLLTYQGWADPVVNPIDTIAYYDRVKAMQGSQAETDAFFRLFMVPGMGHCSGGAGVNLAPGPGQAPDPTNDLLMAMDRWVETKQGPDRLVGARATGTTLVRTRPLCPYPKRAVYDGQGDTNKAESFRCA
ncbi:MAG: tannase/feruloyl esterase family alpha/beta hydrolase [Caulobacteraceae bacterium]|nr:tannase/feruloyl esterase family alpha/beta hydrolase [Caulobacteraceae bacterium]